MSSVKPQRRYSDWYRGAVVVIFVALCGVLTDAARAQDLGYPRQQSALSGDFHRAGNPQCVSRWAQFSREKHQGSYYVGGGRAVGGEGRYTNEGTWGSDYAPWYTRVSLRWSHGGRYQGGGGQYEPDRHNRPLRVRAP